MEKRNALKIGFLSCVALIAMMSTESVAQQTPAERAAYFTPQDWPIKTIRKDKVYFIPGGGSDATVIIGDKGVIVVDPKVNKATGEQLLKEIATLTPKPVTHVIETHSDCDHVNGIVAFPKSVQIIAHINNRKEQEQIARLATVEINGGYGVAPQDRLPNVLITKNKETATQGPQVFKFEKNGSPTGWIENAEGILATDADVYVTGHGDDTMTKDQVRTRIANFRAKMAKVDALAASGKSLAETVKEMGDRSVDPLANSVDSTTIKECPRGIIAMSDSWIRWHEWTYRHQALDQTALGK